ncbi:MAG: excinuclease ABC subunit UvrA [Prevotella sp.]|nr:excinuclease ABC subunit UvrA [Prevotella sp.]
MSEYIEIKGARVNNLKNIDIRIPRNKFIVVTGVSGSGKSSLAFDTLYAEGQRRYVESLSAYARQFLGRKNKPECDFIKGIPPAIAIEQKVISRNPRSTVGTTTEIYEYLRLLFARIGKTYSPVSGNEVKKHSTEDILRCVREFSAGTKFAVMTPLHIAEGRTPAQQLRTYIQQGYSRILYKGEFHRIEDFLAENTDIQHPEDIYLVVARMSVDNSQDFISRLTDATETAFYEGSGGCRIMFIPSMICYDFSTRFEEDGITFEEPSDNMFSFNSPAGACPECQGFGNIVGIDEKLVIPNTSLSVYDGCVVCWNGEKMSAWRNEFCRRAAIDNFPIFEPYYNLTQKQKDQLWHGLPCDRKKAVRDRACIDAFFMMVKENQYKIQYLVMMNRYRGKTTCPVCHGTRLKKEAGYVKIGGKSISNIVEMPIVRLAEWFDRLQLTEHETKIAKRLLTEIRSRLQFLLDVGLGYLTLNRMSNTLSGGESQRINLTKSLGSSLVGSLYILDEPSIGLHSRDTERLIHALKELQELGNTVVIVEHDEDIMKAADYIIDIGPDAGRLGGTVVFEGNASLLDGGNAAEKYPDSHTVKYLTGTDSIPLPAGRRHWNKGITIKGARMNNLRGIDVTIPLNVFTAVTGVSGSGKSSLIKGILFPAVKRLMGDVYDAPGEHTAIEGDLKSIKHIEFVDQNPIGKSTRSNPATYMKAYDAIRDLFAQQPLAQQMGFTAQYFSFNADGGRCDECKGAGIITVEMQFMADLVLTCECCHGHRFKKDILDVTYQGKNIDDVLNMTVSEAIAFFTENKQNQIVRRLKPLEDVGLGYIKLGQNSSTLSGGENQRVKLAYFIGHENQEPTLFIFDEPTTGLHFHDIKRLLKTFNALIDRGHTIVVIEHNLDVVKCADHVIDMGPDGGDKGGELVACGTPEDICQNPRSMTGKYLKGKLSS